MAWGDKGIIHNFGVIIPLLWYYRDVISLHIPGITFEVRYLNVSTILSWGIKTGL